MKILTPVKRVVDYNVKIRVKPDGSGVETNNVKMSINPFDEIAVEAALQLKENGLASEVIAITVGTSSSEETLRHALAMGADRAIRVDFADELEPLMVAKILQKVAAQEQPELIILGKQAIDDDCNQTAQMLAGLLNWAQGTFASKIAIADGTVAVTREVDGGLVTEQLKLPAVISTDLRLNEPRYISLPNIMKAKQKPLTVIPVSDLDVSIKQRLTVKEVQPPPQRQAGIKVESLTELLEKLHDKERIL